MRQGLPTKNRVSGEGVLGADKQDSGTPGHEHGSPGQGPCATLGGEPTLGPRPGRGDEVQVRGATGMAGITVVFSGEF